MAGFRDERETDRLIREEQDHAYQRSLIDDQLREAAAAQEQRRAADVIRNCANPTSGNLTGRIPLAKGNSFDCAAVRS